MTVSNVRYVHTNIVAQDWKRLAKFYIEVFGCKLVPPERDLSGQWLDDVTSIRSAHIHGAHLRAPGYGNTGPTIEIFQYDVETEKPRTAVNRPGFGHIAFAVDDVDQAHEAVIAAGGSDVGKIVTAEIDYAGKARIVYVTDPEGNVIELQHWFR